VSTPERPIFHLSFPVTSLAASIDFYRQCLGAHIGRSGPDWTDVIVFGHQLTLHDKPAQVHPREARGVRHFGVILDWAAWESVRARVLAYRPTLEKPIQHRLVGEPGEHVKLLIEDPDDNLIEVKAYKQIESVVG
jgi:uncharacterized protein